MSRNLLPLSLAMQQYMLRAAVQCFAQLVHDEDMGNVCGSHPVLCQSSCRDS